MDEQTLWALERRFWLDGAAFYDQFLDPECLMAFPGMGVMRVETVLEASGRHPDGPK